MFGSITVRTAEFPVPEDVQALMSVRTPLLTFKFLDPVECLMRLMTTGPLSADMGNRPSHRDSTIRGMPIALGCCVCLLDFRGC